MSNDDSADLSQNGEELEGEVLYSNEDSAVQVSEAYDIAEVLGKVKTLIRPCGASLNSCGYCHQETNTSNHFGFMADSLDPRDFDDLLQHGWGRSGKYFYLPLNHHTCCPQYISRLNPLRFVPDREQRKFKRKLDHYLGPVGPSEFAFDVTEERASLTTEKFLLFEKYTRAIHPLDTKNLSESSFAGFLVDSPMNQYVEENPEFSMYGTFHSLYRDRHSGQLLAVGVLDRLPSGINSAYFFYDPDYRHRNLGKLSALYELSMARALTETAQQSNPSQICYYYLGFYVHRCSRMNYKKKYYPQELLCPLTHDWVDLSACEFALDRADYTPLVEPFKDLRFCLFPDLGYLQDVELGFLCDEDHREDDHDHDVDVSEWRMMQQTRIDPAWLEANFLLCAPKLLGPQVVGPSELIAWLVEQGMDGGVQIMERIIDGILRFTGRSLINRFTFEIN